MSEQPQDSGQDDTRVTCPLCGSKVDALPDPAPGDGGDPLAALGKAAAHARLQKSLAVLGRGSNAAAAAKGSA